MADIITGTTTGYVNNLPDNTLLAVQSTKDSVKDSRYDVIAEMHKSTSDLSRQLDAIDDSTTAALHQVSRDTMDLRAQVTSVGYQVRDGFVAAAKDAEINALKTQIELAKQTTYVSDKIDDGNRRLSDLIQVIERGNNERHLIERNTELVAALDDGRFWRGRYDDSQWQSLNSRLQAFQSDLSDTRQGMVNFGTMAGVGQSSTTNQVR